MFLLTKKKKKIAKTSLVTGNTSLQEVALFGLPLPASKSWCQDSVIKITREKPLPELRCRRDHILRSIVQIIIYSKCDVERERERNREKKEKD